MNEKAGMNCMYCGSNEVVKNGTREFSRRYRCKNCNKQFSLNVDDSLNIHKFLNMLDACTNFTEETTTKEMRQKIMGIKQLFEILPKVKEVKDSVKQSLKEELHEEEDHPMDRISTLSAAEFNDLEDKLVREKERRLRKGEAVWNYDRFKKREDGSFYNASSDVELKNSDGESINNEDYDKYRNNQDDDEVADDEREETSRTRADFEDFCKFMDENPFGTSEEYRASIRERKKKEKEQEQKDNHASATPADESEKADDVSMRSAFAEQKLRGGRERG